MEEPTAAQVESNEEEEEQHTEAEEDAFLFRDWSRKVQEQLRKIGDTIQTGLTNVGLANAQENTTNLIVESSMEAMINATALYQIPAYALMLDERGRPGIPVIFSMLQLQIVDSGAFSLSLGTQFSLELSYPPRKLVWRLSRRLIDFVRLHAILTFRHLQGHLPNIANFPDQLHYLFDVGRMSGMSKEERHEERRRLTSQRRAALQVYLQSILTSLSMNVSAELCEFLEISGLAMNLTKTHKGLEGYLRLRLEYNPTRQRWISRVIYGIFSWLPYFWPWMPSNVAQSRWVAIRSSCVLLSESIVDRRPCEVLLCDKHWHIEVIRNSLQGTSVIIRNGSKKVRLEGSSYQLKHWIHEFELLQQNSPWCREHRFSSFAPVRSGCDLVTWYVDAEEYFSSLYEALESAHSSIYILGWWVSPELHLLRPGSRNSHARLDRLLQRKASQGLMIYILIFKEISLSLPINSHHTKTALERLHPNIRVQRHPDHYSRGIIYWAHHEKLVVIDEGLGGAFTGGLDLCFGRYDTQSHRLTDLSPSLAPEMSIWTGLDYANPRVRDFSNVHRWDQELLDRKHTPRMPWHDVHMKVSGASAFDLARHFIQRWNFVKSEKAMHKTEKIPFLVPADFSEDILQAEVHTTRLQVLRSVGKWSLGMPIETSIQEAYIYAISVAQDFILIENQFFISNCLADQCAANAPQNRITKALKNRILKAHALGQPFFVVVILPLMPAFEAELDRPEASSVRTLMQAQYNTICRGPQSLLEQLRSSGIPDPSKYISFFGLRTHDRLNDRWVTEQIYVHSKLLIVDDGCAILGSANINDRSMLGNRDSELAMFIEADNEVKRLRQKLLREHSGRDIQKFDAEAFVLLKELAQANTLSYRELFACIPDDQITTWSEFRSHKMRTPTGVTISDDQCRLVEFPLHFMEDVDMAVSVLSPEYLLPVEVYL